MNIIVRETTLADFFNSDAAKERIKSDAIATLVSLMRDKPGVTSDSIFLDFLRSFTTISIIMSGDEESEEDRLISFQSIQQTFQDLLLARKRMEEEDFEKWMAEPAYEKKEAP